ncbi:biotin--[acetyl-CoA-carboxylase] ligase [Microcoleus sp. FACHB-831]|uniref:biotin--[acetyl-CoA-carboxylase] ligase n=1 Tax=Microcoleus sp. FACHB-831 TaxID=2692827 RepID=UPI00168596D4|nr:biotin--[acetyl-CoA-carboxylase] ligase [Microcoleus sp. FACHB-831]MBD1924634.1 biotin--[acetyl-CoA-carboxylase] ligase [Microcoleus sp. FACHB-831]
MTFNQQQLEALLQDAAPLQLSCHIFETLPSTNQTLWKLIEEGATAGTVVIAQQQTAGRGQWGRQWQSSAGGLYLSMALEPDLPAVNSAALTMCSAWGIATELRKYAVPVLIKWPNDLIVQGRKLGGILTETRVNKNKIAKAVVGVGINWDNPVPETGINLRSQGKDTTNTVTSLEMLAAIAIRGLLSGYQRLHQEDIETLLPSYLELLGCINRPVVVDGCPGVVVGVCSTGELRVRLQLAATTSEICLKPGTISLGYDI